MDETPEHLWRHPTRAAIDSLAKRLDLANEPSMQDWEVQVADSARIDEFLCAYESGELSEDERFVLMQIIIESCEILESDLKENPDWHRALALIEQEIDVHISSVWYRSCPGTDVPAEAWRVAPWMREILTRHRSRFESKSSH